MQLKVKVKDSYGIALFKQADGIGDKLRLLLVKKRCSHYFCSFVHGNYKIDDESRLRVMFHNMTPSEKTYILGGNFDEIWYKMWLHHPLCSKSIKDYFPPDSVLNIEDTYYYKCERKYYEIYNSGALPRLIENTRSISGIWEIPKGKRKNLKFDGINESPLDCAIREFHEEVNIKPSDYEFLQREPLLFTLEDDGVIYKMHIYPCVIKNKLWQPVVSFSKYSYFTEIDDMGWFSCGMIAELNISDKQKRFLISQYKALAARVRKLTS